MGVRRGCNSLSIPRQSDDMYQKEGLFMGFYGGYRSSIPQRELDMARLTNTAAIIGIYVVPFVVLSLIWLLIGVI